MVDLDSSMGSCGKERERQDPEKGVVLPNISST